MADDYEDDELPEEKQPRWTPQDVAPPEPEGITDAAGQFHPRPAEHRGTVAALPGLPSGLRMGIPHIPQPPPQPLQPPPEEHGAYDPGALNQVQQYERMQDALRKRQDLFPQQKQYGINQVEQKIRQLDPQGKYRRGSPFMQRSKAEQALAENSKMVPGIGLIVFDAKGTPHHFAPHDDPAQKQQELKEERLRNHELHVQKLQQTAQKMQEDAEAHARKMVADAAAKAEKLKSDAEAKATREQALLEERATKHRKEQQDNYDKEFHRRRNDHHKRLQDEYNKPRGQQDKELIKELESRDDDYFHEETNKYLRKRSYRLTPPAANEHGAPSQGSAPQSAEAPAAPAQPALSAAPTRPAAPLENPFGRPKKPHKPSDDLPPYTPMS